MIHTLVIDGVVERSAIVVIPRECQPNGEQPTNQNLLDPISHLPESPRPDDLTNWDRNLPLPHPTNPVLHGLIYPEQIVSLENRDWEDELWDAELREETNRLLEATYNASINGEDLPPVALNAILTGIATYCPHDMRRTLELMSELQDLIPDPFQRLKLLVHGLRLSNPTRASHQSLARCA